MQTLTVSSSLQTQKRGRLAERYLSLVLCWGISERYDQGTKGPFELRGYGCLTCAAAGHGGHLFDGSIPRHPTLDQFNVAFDDTHAIASSPRMTDTDGGPGADHAGQTGPSQRSLVGVMGWAWRRYCHGVEACYPDA